MLVRVLQRNRTNRGNEYGGTYVCVCVYIYTHTHTNIIINLILDIYLEREREGDKERSKMRFIIETEKSQDLPSESWRSRNLVV